MFARDVGGSQVATALSAIDGVNDKQVLQQFSDTLSKAIGTSIKKVSESNYCDKQ